VSGRMFQRDVFTIGEIGEGRAIDVVDTSMMALGGPFLRTDPCATTLSPVLPPIKTLGSMLPA
jgi:hypothetical protein